MVQPTEPPASFAFARLALCLWVCHLNLDRWAFLTVWITFLYVLMSPKLNHRGLVSLHQCCCTSWTPGSVYMAKVSGAQATYCLLCLLCHIISETSSLYFLLKTAATIPNVSSRLPSGPLEYTGLLLFLVIWTQAPLHPGPLQGLQGRKCPGLWLWSAVWLGTEVTCTAPGCFPDPIGQRAATWSPLLDCVRCPGRVWGHTCITRDMLEIWGTIVLWHS